ncbi:hypothetical protein HY493_01360 [Candidatus Woesearchaeota archaeon]|nr:hypothetical protein [Candidatus Woesearchaeota archaeon]
MKRTFTILAILSVFLVACQPAREPVTLPVEPGSVVHDVPPEQPVSSPMPAPGSDVPEMVVEPTPVEQEPAPAVNVMTIEADDKGFYPSSTITATKGETVRVTFKVRTTNVYYGGLQIKGPLFSTGDIKPGQSVTVEFIADSDSTFASYWPSTSVKKADGTIDVT